MKTRSILILTQPDLTIDWDGAAQTGSPVAMESISQVWDWPDSPGLGGRFQPLQLSRAPTAELPGHGLSRQWTARTRLSSWFRIPPVPGKPLDSSPSSFYNLLAVSDGEC
jgi:hypothetical protein